MHVAGSSDPYYGDNKSTLFVNKSEINDFFVWVEMERL